MGLRPVSIPLSCNGQPFQASVFREIDRATVLLVGAGTFALAEDLAEQIVELLLTDLTDGPDQPGTSRLRFLMLEAGNLEWLQFERRGDRFRRPVRGKVLDEQFTELHRLGVIGVVHALI